MKQNRRRHGRVPVPERLQGSLAVWADLRVLDLSETGALIEHGEPLVSGETCLLAVRLAGVELRLQARVVWCQVHSIDKLPTGNGKIRFRSGLHFSDLPEGAEGHLRQYLATLDAPKVAPTHGLE